jgi:hypothetical protein
VHCPFTQTVWDRLSFVRNQICRWLGTSLSGCFDSWTKDITVPNTLVVHICWYIWLERNLFIFEDKAPSVWAVICKTIRVQSSCSSTQKLVTIRRSLICHLLDYSTTFFDGVSIRGGSICGAGGVIKTPDMQVYR